jgi:hypothetical protein
VISSDSSRTLSVGLARDIKQLGENQSDGLGELALKLRDKLEAAKLPVQSVCSRIRIVSVHATDEDAASIRAAEAELAHICKNYGDVGDAWNRLYRDATSLIEHRGHRTASSIVGILRNANVGIASDAETPGCIVAKLVDWSLSVNATFSIFGISKPLPVGTAWIPLRVAIREAATAGGGDLSAALDRYHAWDKHNPSRDTTLIEPDTLGQYIRRAVVVGGPGMGKSTLLTRLARQYAGEGYPVLRVNLMTLAARIKHQGCSFSEGLFALALGGSGLNPQTVQNVQIEDWVLLGDGLDECGADQEIIARGLIAFAAGYPNCRILVTTRPVGYHTSLLGEWRHYELPPLLASTASEHLVNLVQCIVDEDTPLHKEAPQLVDTQLKMSKASEIVVRSPLMLGLAASLVVRGGTLGQTKSQLYRNVFELIDAAPSARVTSALTPGWLVNRFLEIIGWDLINNPLSPVPNILGRCASELVQEMQVSTAKARQTAEDCLRYWQDIGMLERISHAGQETVTFIHKTFGEFAAARYLKQLPDDARHKIIADRINDDGWSEVVNFAAALGLITPIIEIMLERQESAATARSMVERAIVLASEADDPPDAAIRRELIVRAFKYVQSERRSSAYTIGKAMVPLATRLPAEIGSVAAALLNDKQPWTRLVGWACAVAAGPPYYDLGDLGDLLRDLPNLFEPSVRPSLAGGMMMSGDGAELARQLALSATREIIDRSPAGVADVLLPEVLKSKAYDTVGFHIDMEALLKEKGKTYRIGDFSATDRQLNFAMPDKDYGEAQREAYQTMFGPFDDGSHIDAVQLNDDGSKPLLHLSALLSLISYMESPASDIWGWTKDYHVSAASDVLTAVVALSPIDRVKLQRDVRVFLDHLKALKPDGVFAVLRRIVHVDIPEPEWTRVPTLNLNRPSIERALAHRSSWLVQLAANLLYHAASPGELQSIVSRVYANGRSLALWAATALATGIPPEIAGQLTRDRLLNQPLVPGCQYLFDLLRRLATSYDDGLRSILRIGMFDTNVKNAIAASELAGAIITPSTDGLPSLLLEAYEHWLVHEEPYPTGGGVIPDSPRKQILSALLKVHEFPISQLLTFTADPRSEIRDLGTSGLTTQLSQDTARKQFIAAALSESMPPSLLTQILRSNPPFTESEIQELCGLLKSSNPRFRYAALHALDSSQLEPGEVEGLIRSMTQDAEPDIREAAFRRLDQRSASIPPS